MADQVLKGPGGKLLGQIRVVSSGKHEGRDATGKLKGKYDPKRDETRDANGKLVGKGNLLATLIVS